MPLTSALDYQSRKRALMIMSAVIANMEAERLTEEESFVIKRRIRRQRLEMALMRAVLARSRRRVVQRNVGGWEASTINQYVVSGDETTFRENFRVTQSTFKLITEKLEGARYVTSNRARNPAQRQTAAFKIGVCMYYLAHGKGSAKVVGDAAGLGRSTVELYLTQFIAGVLNVLRPIYMPSTPPSPEMIKKIREQFASRRGISNVAMAVDGSHVPFAGGPEYRNYKGWESILAVAFVNSYYLFVNADVGQAGCAGDNTVLSNSWMLKTIKSDPEAWLGVDGVIAADAGASDGGELLLNPYFDAKEDDELWFNFCHSSTRFFVEETFGRWKNRFRFLLYDSTLSHTLTTQLIYVSMILHNVCTVHKDDFDLGDATDADWQAYFDKYARHSCPSCTRKDAMHCPHAQRRRSAQPAKGGDAKAKRDELKAAMMEEVECELDHRVLLQQARLKAQRK
jgi:hypothetical protein